MREALTGRSVRLRALAEGDGAAVAEAIAETLPLLKRRFRWFDGPAPEAAARYLRARPNAFCFGVFDAAGERLHGVAGLEDQDDETQKAELSMWIREKDQDKGRAFEAGKLVVEHGFKKLGLHRLYARIDPTNRPARRVLQRLGFRYEGCLRGDKRLHNRWIDQECWGILKSEWKR